MAIQERYVATDGDNTDAQGTYDAAVDLAHACSLTVALKYAAAGDRINLKNGNKAGASATYTRAASDTVTVDGTVAAPIIIRGYNSTIGDLDGVGRTSGNGALISTNYPVIAYNSGQRPLFTGADYWIFIDLKVTGTYDGDFLYVGNSASIQKCIVENASTHATATVVNVASKTGVSFINSDLSHTGASGGEQVVDITGSNCTVYGCRLTGKATGINASGAIFGLVYLNNTIIVSGIAINSSGLTNATYPVRVCGNTIYGGSGGGYVGRTAAVTVADVCIDNHITDCTDYAFDSGYKGTAQVPGIFAYNRTRDNSSGAIDGFGDYESTLFNHVITDTGGAETDYVDAANGDFNLISAAPGRGKASMPYRDIGAVQHADPTSTDPGVGNVEAGVEYTINDAAKTGTFAVPTEAQVESGVGFGAGGTEFTGSLDVPTAAEIAAAMWSPDTSPDRTLTA